MSEPLIKYIKEELTRGLLPEQINLALLQAGWSKDIIDNAFSEVNEGKTIPATPLQTPPKTGLHQELKHVSAAQVLLYLGGLIVFIAAVTYIGTNWSQWGALGRILAIFIPTLLCYSIGGINFPTEHKKSATVFLVIGALLLPFLIAIAFRELKIFTEPFNDNFSLVGWSILFGCYLISNFIFKLPIWSFLTQFSVIFIYYYALKLLGFQGISESLNISWMFLIPGTSYLFLSLFYDKKGYERTSYYAYALGSAILILTLFNVFFDPEQSEFLALILLLIGAIFSWLGLSCEFGDYKKFSAGPFAVGTIAIVLAFIQLYNGDNFINEQLQTWILLFLGIIYFSVGTFLESKNLKKYLESYYVIGTIAVFFSLLKIAMSDNILNIVEIKREIIGWQNVAIGLIYSAFGWGLAKLKNSKLTTPIKYGDFFTIVGPLWIIGAIWFLGLDGPKPIPETLLVLLSLGYIFGSIPTKTSRLLYIGTIFLVIYIFSIGAEYFQDNIGWPITLFIAGLLAMGIGISIEKIRTKYFSSPKTDIKTG